MNYTEIYLIIGHRGTGKTTWVKEVKKYFSEQNENILTFDIDQEMQNKTHQTIDQIFEKGESYFRKIENEIAKNCIKRAQSFEGKVFISLGAGYKGDIPTSCKVIHLKRFSDQMGRIFFDRPQVLYHLNSFDEYQELYSKRKQIYAQQRDLVFTRLDYFKSFQKWDKIFLGEEELPFKNGVLTLSGEYCPSSQENLDYFLDQKLRWGLRHFELKDNEISDEFLEKVLLKIPLHKILFSFRCNNNLLFRNLFNQIKPQSLTIDWPLEWGVEHRIKNHEKISWIYSLHKRGPRESLSVILDQLPKQSSVHLKLAVEVFSFEELWQGHLWQQKDPKHRSFHPRSADGRWKWYRLLFSPHQPLYFIREDNEEGVLDQPVMAESVRCGQGISQDGFVCVLGNPIEHSATPFEQQSFFERYNLPVVPILMKEEEVSAKNIKILENFGMKFSAITSPLKKTFCQLMSANTVKESVDILKINQNNSPVSSLNTLILTKQGWCGSNTDIDGALVLKKYIQQLGFSKIAVWGGGGVRDVLDLIFSLYVKNNSYGILNEKELNSIINELKTHSYENLKSKGHHLDNKNNISFYSARTGKLLKGSDQSPDIVVWAVGRSRMSACLYPPQYWKPLYVFDLNYTDDSPGCGYALKVKSEYVSGWLWFKAQAQAQRILFEKLNNESV